jgi:hypothetical protein
MAKICTVREAVMICRKAGITLMIWGKHGLGKSSIIQQIATENEMGIINLRLSQLEASDIRGLPDKDLESGRTVYRPPSELPSGDIPWEDVQKLVLAEKEPAKQHELCERLQPHIKNGILFLDESFRAQDDVQQAVFELVLDRKVGQYVLPPNWSICCANNFFEGYLNNAFMDPAFLDRFCHIILSDGESTTQEWVNYMIGVHGDRSAEIIEFCAASQENLDGRGSHELGFAITPSRRAWDMVARVLESCEGENFSEDAKTEVIAGLVGRDMALSFSRYKCPVKPRDVIEKGVKAIAGKLGKLQRNQFVGLTWGLGSHLSNHMTDKKYIMVALDFADWMLKNTKEKDLITGFLTGLVTGDANDRIKSTRRAALANPKVAALINKAEKKIGKKDTLLQELEKRPALSKLVSKTSWGL